MPSVNKSVKLNTEKHADILAWLEENDVVFQSLVIYLLRIAMLIGTTRAPVESVELGNIQTVLPETEDEPDFLADILNDLEAIK